jgi:hypothetical protein
MTEISHVTGKDNVVADVLSRYPRLTDQSYDRDGVSHCTKTLSIFYDDLDTTDPNDPEVIIKIDISNTFNSACRVLTVDVLSGHASCDYVCVLKKGQVIPTCENPSGLFG